jgi:methyl-accepting chemotaxis protein
LCGQTVNVAVVIDASKYLDRVLELDARARLARVEPGVVCDALRSAAERHGLTFGPDPATHSRCTLGGMIGNNSCGAHSVMAGKTVENVEALGRADSEMAGLVRAVQETEGTVNGLVDRMTSLHAQSRQISEIVGMIDGIAFQTNILALNASVEAARAGDMGRGFAVVAQEVRSLAQRSAAAAQQIKGIVSRSTSDIEAGSALAAQAGQRVAHTVGSAGSVAESMAQALSGSREQRDRVGEVHATLTDLSSATQSNAALVEEVAAATTSLDASSQELHELVAGFRIGSAARA